MLYTSKQYQVARKLGYRSGLEVKLSEFLDELKVKYIYEGIKIEWEDLAYRHYTPDFVLPNGIIVETNFQTGLAKKITRLIHGGSLTN